MNVKFILTKPVSTSVCRFLFVLLALATATAWGFHAFHTSLTEIRYNAQERYFEISMRVFKDDLETALTNENQHKKVVLDASNKYDALIEKYVQKHFVLTNAQNQKLGYRVLGKEQEGDAIWLYIELPHAASLNGVKMQQAMLLDSFDDQTNIVNIFIQNDKKSYIFNQKNRLFTIGL